MVESLPPPFTVGHSYEDEKGTYTVISVENGRMKIERENGSTQLSHDIKLKAQIHRRILRQRNALSVSAMATDKLRDQPEKKMRELTEYEKEYIRRRTEQDDANARKLAEEIGGVSWSQIAGVKARMKF